MGFSDHKTVAADPRIRGAVVLGTELAMVALCYFAAGKLGLMLASINPSATPIWPASGLALAAVLLLGYRVAPAIFVGAFLANAITAGTLWTSAAIGAGNTLEAVLGVYLIERWAYGRDSFQQPGGVARFSLICFLPPIASATIGVGTLALAGFADPDKFGSIWLTWWLGDLGGALMVTPVVVLWVRAGRALAKNQAKDQNNREQKHLALILAYGGAFLVGLLAFSPLLDRGAHRAPLGFLAFLPLLWAALRCGQRHTATVALILSGFAIWGTQTGARPFAPQDINESFLLLLMFMTSMAVPSLALAAEVAVRRRTEDNLRRTQDELNERVVQRTAALTQANLALQEEVERRKQAESELEQQRLNLLEAQRLAKIGSWTREVDEERATWSDQLFDIYGLEPGSFVGSLDHFLKLVHPEDRERVRGEVARAIETGEGFRSERRIVRPSGEVRYLQASGEVVKNDQGRVVRLVGVCQDVTERREAELTLERTREQLAQAQKMEALGQLTGGIAHDFNNLLMIVSGHAEMLRRRLAEPKQLQSVDAVLAAARRGENLTRQLLTFSRPQPLNPQTVNIKDRIEAMQAMLGSSLCGNIALVVDIASDTWPIEVDVAEFELALVNMAVNARDAMPDGGTFKISACNATTLRRGQRGETLEHVELSLADTGQGIPCDTLPKIFDPFFTTKAVGKGTGLGLSQVYGFVQQSGGTVRARSEAGRGTTITMHLPRSKKTLKVEVAEPAAPHPVPAQSEGVVLVVEDNPEVADVTVTFIEQMGFQTLRAENAAEALVQLARTAKIDLVFSDIVMPNGMNGIHLAQEIAEHYPRVRILLATGYSEVAAAAETRFPILRKPFEVSALERAVRDVLNGPVGGGQRRAAR